MANELIGTKAPSESKTIVNAKAGQWTAILGTAAVMLLQYLPQLQETVLPFIPPHLQPIAVGALQLLTAGLTYFFGKRAIDGRIEATERVVVTKK